MQKRFRISSFCIFLPLICGLWSNETYGRPISNKNKAIVQDSLQWADYYYNIHRYEKAIALYKKSLERSDKEVNRVLRRLALSEAATLDADKSMAYVYDYLKLDFQPNFLLHEGFDTIRETEEFKKVSERIIPSTNLWGLVYFFVALIGFYVVCMLLLNKKIEIGCRFLIASFVFIHSLFILNISINQANFLFEFPHTYLMSTWSSFLYGPLLFFYFRRVSHTHHIQWKDMWHLFPTLVFLAYLFPNVYLFSGREKIYLMLTRLQIGISPEDSSKLVLIVTLKALSLALYAFFVHKILVRFKNASGLNSKTIQWQKNIYYIHVTYVATYIVYGLSITSGKPYPFLYHIPIILMATMVLYVGYAANVQPDVFSGLYKYTNKFFPKYIKSGLTKSLSLELKQNLTDLFEKENLHLRNDINLEMVAQKLNTTRHNASQIINEHFGMNFHELINQFRIKEAKELLQKKNKQNIIDIAYEVGYNNKVTFNKAFKKETQLTPSQYLLDFKKGCTG